MSLHVKLQNTQLCTLLGTAIDMNMTFRQRLTYTYVYICMFENTLMTDTHVYKQNMYTNVYIYVFI